MIGSIFGMTGLRCALQRGDMVFNDREMIVQHNGAAWKAARHGASNDCTRIRKSRLGDCENRLVISERFFDPRLNLGSASISLAFVFDDCVGGKTGDEVSAVLRVHGFDKSGGERAEWDVHGNEGV